MDYPKLKWNMYYVSYTTHTKTSILVLRLNVTRWSKMPWVHENWELQEKWFGKLSVVTSTPPAPHLQGPLFLKSTKTMSPQASCISEVIQTLFLKIKLQTSLIIQKPNFSQEINGFVQLKSSFLGDLSQVPPLRALFRGLGLALMVKNLPAMQENQVQSLGWEDPLEKEMWTHYSILACRIPRAEEPRALQSMGSQRVRHDWVTNTLWWKTKIIVCTYGCPTRIYNYLERKKFEGIECTVIQLQKKKKEYPILSKYSRKSLRKK